MPPGRRPAERARGKRRGNSNRRHWARRLHRWLGVGTLLFAVVLSVTGIVLNHSDSLGLTERYVQTGWLLDWYGIEAPPPAASYRAGEHRATQLGERIYFNGRELAAAAGPLAGVVEVNGIFAVAAGRDLLLVTADGDLIERMEVARDGVGAITRAGRQGRSVVMRLDGRWYRSDDQVAALTRVDGIDEADVEWSASSAVPPSDLSTLKRLYRGRGVTGERLVADFHSGRLFGRYGPLVMDTAGLALLVLGVSGLILFLRRRKK